MVFISACLLTVFVWLALALETVYLREEEFEMNK